MKWNSDTDKSHDLLEKEGVIMRIFPLDLTTKTDELKKLIAENPDLPIVVLAGTDATDGEQSMYCGDIRFGQTILCRRI